MAEIINFNKGAEKTVVLVSPLDWGLGHTTRCIPIIRELLVQDCTVIIACNSVQKALLESEFPDCAYVNLRGYDLRYGASRRTTLLRILLQIPKILTRINSENRWLNAFLQQNRIQAIISDNRFGLHHPLVPSVFLTHQLHIKTGLGRLSEGIIQSFNYRRIAKFNTCWVPDYKGANSMAGLLSNTSKLPGIPVHYLGGLSRLQKCSATPQTNLLIVLSGPEPQRTLFEKQLLSQLPSMPVSATLVRGLPGAIDTLPSTPTLTVYNHVPAKRLNQLICEADLIISRSGYTTVMDLLKLGKKSILVPTPGQAEQEYLAAHLQQQQLAFTMQQTDFALVKALDAARQFQYRQLEVTMEEYRTVVREWLGTIKG